MDRKKFLQEFSLKGVKARAKKLTPEQKSTIARKAAQDRWGLPRIREDIRAIVMGAGGDQKAMERVLKSEPKVVLIRAWEKLRELGARPRHRVPHEVDWARSLVRDLLPTGFGEFADRRPHLTHVACGLLDVMAEEVRKYHRERSGKGK